MEKNSRKTIACLALAGITAAGGIYAQHRWDVTSKAVEMYQNSKTRIESALTVAPEEKIQKYIAEIKGMEASGDYSMAAAVQAFNNERPSHKVDYEAAVRLAAPEGFEGKAMDYIGMLEPAQRKYVAEESLRKMSSPERLATIDSLIGSLPPESQKDVLEKALEKNQYGLEIAMGKIKRDIEAKTKDLYDKVFTK